MMARLQHIGPQGQAVCADIRLRLGFGVATEDKVVVPVLHPDSDGPVIQIISVILVGGQNGKGGFPQFPHIPHLRQRQAQIFHFDGVQHFFKGSGGMFNGREEYAIHFKGLDDVVQPADMVGMGVSADHIVQLVNALGFQIRNHHVPLIVFTGVYQHAMVLLADQDAVPLAHVDEMDLEPILGKLTGGKRAGRAFAGRRISERRIPTRRPGQRPGTGSAIAACQAEAKGQDRRKNIKSPQKIQSFHRSSHKVSPFLSQMENPVSLGLRPLFQPDETPGGPSQPQKRQKDLKGQGA